MMDGIVIIPGKKEKICPKRLFFATKAQNHNTESFRHTKLKHAVDLDFEVL